MIYEDGWQTQNFTCLKDVVQANIRSTEGDAHWVFNVASCKRVDLNELASLIMGITIIPVPLVYEPQRPAVS
jgi:nucleoside-diphosphate-sugar epimerase